ncbi:Methyltransferase domain-containing protein [Porphyromonadaceae bacterium KHP3R9]|nr:Methyltransferase domain-containing protein [Porphyromonadaceae bacterium KHP3R9]
MPMRTLEETIAAAMDVSDMELLPFLPYILQDFWEIGADPGTIVALIRKHDNNRERLRVLDLGCGKGAVSVRIAAELGHACYGIDAIPQFVEDAIQKAEQCGVGHLCRFEVGDIRERIRECGGHDIIILGAVGDLLGNSLETLTALQECLATEGMIVIDDGYTDDSDNYRSQASRAGMVLVDEVVFGGESAMKKYDEEYFTLERRCLELIGRYPEKQNLFAGYIRKQQLEYDKMRSEIVCSTMVFKRTT